ncbi:MAG TPA: PilC/PilY family type IV pilus protein [Burkholderiales bacterium]|nr:PilC/PilY family type IV pilus protein [Burkholderiales bacterium]
MTTVQAALTDIAPAPLANAASSVVKPNLMFVLDDSGSMDNDFMPDSVHEDPACKDDDATLRDCDFADPTYNSAQFNSIYYNPDITYTPAVNYDGTSRTSYTTWTAVPNDAYGIQFTGTIDLTTAYPDTVWCNADSGSGNISSTNRTPPFASGECKRPIQSGVWTYPNSTFRYQYSVVGDASNPLHPYYYTISSVTWCSNRDGTNGFGTTPCQAKKTPTFQYPRYGTTGSNGFTRVDIVSTTANYPRAVTRDDCTGAYGPTGCTYAQEMTNFANWYAYYRTRMQMMKTASGLAFKQVSDAYRVGFVTINPGSPVAAAEFLSMGDFTAGAGNQKNNWYTKFYATAPNGFTPLREALSRVGRYYAHVTTGINAGMTGDPLQYSCQQNFTILSTDGFWNDNAGQKLDGTAIGHQDSNPATAPRPLLDGSFQLTEVTSNNTYNQRICTGNATVFGATGCGCAANFKRVKQQTSASVSTVVSRDGVILSTTPTTPTTYQDITACNAVVTTAITPTIREDEQAVNGSANTTFAAVNGVTAGANQAGSCPANFGRIKHRTTTATSTVVTTGGVAAPAVLDATYAFSDVGACVALTNTVVTRFTVVQEQTLTANAVSTFGDVTPAGISGTPGGNQATGTCGSNRARIWRRTTTYDQTVVTVGGTVNPATFSANVYNITAVGGGCTDLTSVTTTPITDTIQWVGGETSPPTDPTAFPAAGNGVNNQTTYVCTQTSGAAAQLWTSKQQRITGYNRFVTTVGGGAPATTFSGNTSGPTFSTVQACSATAKTATNSSVPGATTGPVVTGHPVAAAPTTNSNVQSNTTTGGPTPAGSTSTPGTPTSTSTGAAITGLDFTIGPPTPKSAAATSAGPQSETVNSSTQGPLGYADTLADVAQYYYITDLRPAGSLGAAVSGVQLDVGTDHNVPGQPGTDPQNDSAGWQHMTTFTLGLGVDGTLTYDSEYRTDPTGDFLAISNGSKNWPQPVGDTLTAVDDLWHAAVTGRGRYFSAKDPAELSTGLSKALSNVGAKTGSAAAAATSNLEPVAGDNFAFVASYETMSWNGDVEARTIDLDDGSVGTASIWRAQTELDTLANATNPGGGNRRIKRFNTGATNNLQDFTWANLTVAERAYFEVPWISTGTAALSQWGSLSTAQQTAAAGVNLVNYIRGDSHFTDKLDNLLTDPSPPFAVIADNRVYRDRTHVLGDVVNGAPVYVKQVSASYADPGFASPAGANFKECINSIGVSCGGIYSGARDPVNVVNGVDIGSARSATVYIAANDGMLHALNGNTGVERWAYLPNILIPKLYRLADKDYANRHQFYVDGSPTVGDIYDPVAAKWKTILVGGLGSGGRAYYALDVTDPETPIGLWEFNVAPTASCPVAFSAGATTDCDLGLTHGNPIITKLGNGTWVVVVTSGYNNVSPGDGKGYVYVLNPITGAILKKIQARNPPASAPGSVTTPLGVAKINNWVDDTNVNNTTLRAYAGDMLGNMWRFNLDTETTYAIVRYTDPSGVTQPITTKPELGEVNGVPFVYVGTGRMLGASDLPSVQVQTIYGIKDATNGVQPAAPIVARGTTVVAQTLTNATTETGAGIRTVTSNPVDVSTKNGWRVDLPNSGERVNVDPKLQLGTLIIGSNIPSITACTSGGTSYLNFFDYKTGGYIQSSVGGVAGVLLGNSLVVGISIVRLPDGKTVAIVTTSDNKYPNLTPPFSSPNPTGRRSSFRELQ